MYGVIRVRNCDVHSGLIVAQLLRLLPSAPDPLLWLTDDPPDSRVRELGYQVLHLGMTDEWPAWGTRYAWIYLKLQSLEDSPLSTLSRLSDYAAVGAVLVVDPSEPGQLTTTEVARRWAQIKSLLIRMGWEPCQDDEEMMRFRWSGTGPRYRLSSPSSDDREDCHRLFERAFGEAPDPNLWEWKYGEGRGFSTIARREGRLVAHYGGVSRRILFLGVKAHAVQICDVSVDPAERGVMTKTGAFTSVAAFNQINTMGLDDRHLCGYGFPNQRHVVLGERAGFYAEVETLVELKWDCRPRRPSILTTARPVRLAKKAAAITRLWLAMARDLASAILVVRDVEYLRYRYESHPTVDYRLFLVRRRWGVSLGLLVLRFDGDLCRLVDVVGPVASLSQLIQSARQIAADAGCLKLVMWITSGQAYRFQSAETDVQPLDIKIPGNCLVERVPVETLRNRWWLMMGDTDFL